jgi:response regulator RpfG family c-di-GMP phosphodiesterase
MSLEEIMIEVQRGRGTHFDPMVADAFMRIAKREGTGLLINSAEQVTRKQNGVLHGHSLPEQILRFGNEHT